MENKKLKILLVDDDEPIRTTYADVFKKEGYEVTEAVDGLDGLERATEVMPDVIFTGIIMPRMDGFALKDALAKNVATANIPVVMSSHMGREEDRKKAQEMGVKDFFVLGMITPLQVAEKINGMFNLGEYKLSFNIGEMDAPRLADDFHINHNFECPECYSKMTLALRSVNPAEREFKAKLVCPKCQ